MSNIPLSQIIIKPLITEKSMAAIDNNSYTFEVHPSANKVQIKQAMKTILDVDATKINLAHVSGKNRIFSRVLGRTKRRKKAIVKIKAGQKIELFES